jgi:hypothetical protein
VSAEDCHRIDPVLLFKGKGRVAHTEQQKYAKGVKVIFTPKAVINKPSMDEYVEYWYGKVKKYCSSETASHLMGPVLSCL